MKESFGQRLSRIRKEKGLTQEDIASKITISPQAVSKWENDISSPDILILSSLADILGVSVDELLGREEGSQSVKEEPKERIYVKDDEGESVKFSSEGVHIIGKDGKEVHIGNHGVYVHEKDGEVKKWTGPSKEAKANIIVTSILIGLSIIGFIIMGLLWKENAMGWKIGWTLLFVGPFVGSLMNAIAKHRFTYVAYPLLVVAAYCNLGFLGMQYGFEGWGFYWFLFITIPAYYIIFSVIDKYVLKSVKEDEDDDDEDDDN